MVAVGREDACVRFAQLQRAILCAWELHRSINANNFDDLIKIKYEKMKNGMHHNPNKHYSKR